MLSLLIVIQFPFNNACDPASNSNPTISLFGGLNVEMYKSPHSHVKKTLPPTLVGFPGEADIRYYVKATVNRPSLFKENVRAYVPSSRHVHHRRMLWVMQDVGISST
jgi:hypothetical protein